MIRRFSVLFAMNVALGITVFMHSAFAAKPSKEPPADVYMKPSQDMPSKEEAPLSGKIVETMNSGGYTYLCLEKEGKKTWAATPEMKISVGEEVALQPGYEMEGFTSKTLNRTFDKIIFSNGLLSKQGSIDVKSFHAGAMGGKGAEATAPAAENIKVGKATGANAYTVAEIFKKRAELDRKAVSVSGKVTKISVGIMGKNWLHIQDGSGSAKDGNNDLVVTTQDVPKVGDVVTASGIAYKDKDFGSGYLYSVIVEEASIKKQ